MLKGRHTFTIGTHNEFLDLSNLFIRDNFGTYAFSSLDSLEAGPGAAVTTTASRRRAIRCSRRPSR